MNWFLCFIILCFILSCLTHSIEAKGGTNALTAPHNQSQLAIRYNSPVALILDDKHQFTNMEYLYGASRSRDKRWIIQEIFVSTVNYIKWNFVGRISVSLLDGLMRVIDPVVSLLLPRGASSFTSILLTAIYKKLQFAIMYWFNSLFFYM